MAKRLALLYALKHMEPSQSPGPFAYDAISNKQTAFDGLEPLLNDEHDVVRQAAKKLIQRYFPDKNNLDKLGNGSTDSWNSPAYTDEGKPSPHR